MLRDKAVELKLRRTKGHDDARELNTDEPITDKGTIAGHTPKHRHAMKRRTTPESKISAAGPRKRARQWNTPLPSSRMDSSTAPAPYHPSLTPITSAHRPSCLAKERLRLWRPTNARSTTDEHGQRTALSEQDVARIEELLENTWSASTREAYGAGLLTYHVFCDRKGIAEEQRTPTSLLLIESFIATLAGAYSGKTISNYVSGVRAWHILHGIPWTVKSPELDAAIKAADVVTPPSSKLKKRSPFLPAHIERVREQLNTNIPLDAAVFACLTTTFYAAARLGEFTVQRLDDFRMDLHAKPADVRHEVDQNNLRITIIRLPKTKTTALGEDVYWAKQDGPSDPEEAWCNHLRVNDPPPSAHIFAYKHKNTHRPLTRTAFLKRVNEAARGAGLDPFRGHSLRIGATLMYMLRGLSFELVKTKGRWSSDAFQLYLRDHAQIMAPYMQANPALHDSVLRIALPPVR